MDNIFEISDLLVKNIEKNYENDIAIVAYYGSYANGTPHKNSDLDLFFIPKNKKGNEASFQFIVDNLGIDFWPISWERFEKINSYDDHLISVLLDSKILYYNSKDDFSRFNDLKNNLLEKLKKEEYNPYSKSYEKFLDNYIFLNNLKSSDNLGTIRLELSRIIKNTVSSLSILNKTPLKKGWGKNIEEINDFKYKMENTIKNINSLIIENDIYEIKSKSENFVNSYNRLFKKIIEVKKPFLDVQNIFLGFYEELKSTLNKILDACDGDNYELAFFSVASTIEEIGPLINLVENFVYRNKNLSSHDNLKTLDRLGFPNLLEIMQKDNLKELKNATLDFDKKLLEYFESKNIKINNFKNIKELEMNLKTPD